jgi:hypothetical protein
MAGAMFALLAACGGGAEMGEEAEPFAEWSLVEDLRIDPVTADLTSGGVMLVARNGDILLTQSQDNMIRVFKTDGSTATIGREGGGPGEFRRVIRAGWVGDTLWALDPVLSRISYFGPDYAFIRSVQDPSTGQEAGPQNPVVSTFIQAVLPDGALRALASPYPNTPPPPWLVDIDENETAVVRLSMAGEHLGRLAVQPDDPCRVSWSIGAGGMGGSMLPFCARPISTDWDASTNLATVWVETSEADSARYRVEVIDYRGDTLISRTMPFTIRPISQLKLDSAMARQVERDAQHRQDYLASRPPLPPATFLPPILNVLIGRDGTVWLEEEEELPTHQWRVLNAAGEPIGQVTLPVNARLRVAERGMIWTTFTDDDDLVGIARYRVQ